MELYYDYGYPSSYTAIGRKGFVAKPPALVQTIVVEKPPDPCYKPNVLWTHPYAHP